jgi:hypothetical protein
VGFELTIPVFERVKAFHALDLSATVIGGFNIPADELRALMPQESSGPAINIIINYLFTCLLSSPKVNYKVSRTKQTHTQTKAKEETRII